MAGGNEADTDQEWMTSVGKLIPKIVDAYRDQLFCWTGRDRAATDEWWGLHAREL